MNQIPKYSVTQSLASSQMRRARARAYVQHTAMPYPAQCQVQRHDEIEDAKLP